MWQVPRGTLSCGASFDMPTQGRGSRLGMTSQDGMKPAGMESIGDGKKGSRPKELTIRSC